MALQALFLSKAEIFREAFWFESQRLMETYLPRVCMSISPAWIQTYDPIVILSTESL